MEKFSGSLGNYEFVNTDDGSITVKSCHFDENCHSTAGAYEETIYNYIQGTNVLQKCLTNKSLTIFEVGFGIGVGLKALIDKTRAHKINTKIKFYSTELDKILAIWAIENSPFLKEEGIKKKVSETLISFSIDKIEVAILIGDARETIKKLDSQNTLIDCIFQDPFSPRKNPTLWTKEWFKDLYIRSSDEVILSTYSASVTVRKAIMDSGFYVRNRDGFGNKRSATQAFKSTNTELPKDQKLSNELERSKTKPLSDTNYKELLNLSR